VKQSKYSPATSKEHDWALNFAERAWMSPNNLNKAFALFAVHLEHEGILMSMLLEKVSFWRRPRRGIRKGFEDFGIDDKVSFINITQSSFNVL
jgi:hypothetical protein